MEPIDILWMVANGLLGLSFLIRSRMMILLQRPENFPLLLRKYVQMWRVPPVHLVVGCWCMGQTLLLSILWSVWSISSISSALLPIGIVDFALLYGIALWDVIVLERTVGKNYAHQPQKAREVQAYLDRSLPLYFFGTAFLECAVSFMLFDFSYLPALPQLLAAVVVGGIFLLSYLLEWIALWAVKFARK